MRETHMTDVKCKNEELLMPQARATSVTYDGNDTNTAPSNKNDNMTEHHNY